MMADVFQCDYALIPILIRTAMCTPVEDTVHMSPESYEKIWK